jgi:hypothetical protein
MSNDDSKAKEIRAWFTQRLPEEWVSAPAEVTVDREEITVMLTLPGPNEGLEAATEAAAGEATEAERAQALAGFLARWRAQTRDHRISIAREAEHRFGRKVAWGVQVGEHRELFTHLAVPVMTRLRQAERQVLDTLVEAGVARSRAHALAWCVRLVGQNSQEWLGDLRSAMEQVAKVRQSGPSSQA